jgi:hypothetical protein
MKKEDLREEIEPLRRQIREIVDKLGGDVDFGLVGLRHVLSLSGYQMTH